MQTAACHIFRPAYLHSRNTATPSSAATDIVTVNQSPPFHGGLLVLWSQSSRNARCAFRRDHRKRETHFSHTSAPSLASAPHGHIWAVRQPIRRNRMIRPSPHDLSVL